VGFGTFQMNNYFKEDGSLYFWVDLVIFARQQKTKLSADSSSFFFFFFFFFGSDICGLI